MDKDKRKLITLELERYRQHLLDKKAKKEARRMVRIPKVKKEKSIKVRKTQNEYNKDYYLKNKEKIADRRKKKYDKEIKKEKLIVRSKEPKVPRIKLTDREKKDRTNLKVKQKRESNVQYKLTRSLRSRLYKVIKKDQKVGSAVKDLGCSPDFLKEHLESLFQEGMNWDNYGAKKDNWSIDHIEALSTVDLTNIEDFKRVNHYTNLRPLWNKDQFIEYHTVQKHKHPVK